MPHLLHFRVVNLSDFTLFTIFLLSQLIVGNLYGGGLASGLTVTRYEDPISNIRMLVNSKLMWGGASEDYYYSILNTENPDLRKYIDGFKVCDIPECTALGESLKMSLILEELQYGKFSRLHLDIKPRVRDLYKTSIDGLAFETPKLKVLIQTVSYRCSRIYRLHHTGPVAAVHVDEGERLL